MSAEIQYKPPEELTINSLQNPEAFQNADAIISLVRRALDTKNFKDTLILQLSHENLENPEEIATLIQAGFVQHIENESSRIRKTLKSAEEKGSICFMSTKNIENKKIGNPILEEVFVRYPELHQRVYPMLRRALRIALGVALYHLEDDVGQKYIKQTDQQEMYLATLAIGDELFESRREHYERTNSLESTGHAKKRFLDKLMGLNPDFIKEVLQTISGISMPNLFETGAQESIIIHNRIQQHMLDLVLNKKEELASPENQIAILKTLRIMNGLYSSREVMLYMSQMVDVENALIQKIYESCLAKKITIGAIFCPDWSGSQDVQGNYIYDFHDIGTGIGIIAERGLPIMQLLEKTCREQGLEVNLEADYVIFECPLEGYKQPKTNEIISHETFSSKLSQSAETLKVADHGLNIDTGLCSRIIDQKEYEERVVATMEELRTMPAIEEIVDAIYKVRKGICEKWFPKEIDEDDPRYEKRIREVVIIKQLAQYIALQRAFRERENTIMLCADNKVVNLMAASLSGVALVAGQGSKAIKYFGQ